jgi:hypothetical protein
MVLGEKLFEENGNITGVKVIKVHPIEGVSIEISFTSEIRGEGRFPNSENLASGIVTKYPHGIIDATWQGLVTTSGEDDQYLWWGHEKSRIIEGGKIKGLIVVTGFTKSQKLSWMNNLIIALESEGSVSSQKFKAIGYEWK